jgi:NADH:ubiquinone oxidoreductase subunit 3 (subunit A)
MSNATLAAPSEAILNARDELASFESGASAVSWGAIVAGAVVASALSLALLMLGAGIGLVSVSPWSTTKVSVTAFGILAAAWFIAVQLFASGVGGYLAGRVRTRWVSVHMDEVYFRDTAHGLIVWSVGAIVTAWLLASGAASVVSGAAHAGSSALRSCRNCGCGTGCASCRPGCVKRGKFGGLFHRHAVSH